MSIIENLLDDAGVDPDEIIEEDDRSRANQTVGRDHEVKLGLTEITPGDQGIPVREFESEPNEEQFDALDDIELADPFTLAVKAPDLANEDSTNYAVTAFSDDFAEPPSDRLFEPLVPLSFDEEGIATVTIASGFSDLSEEPVPISRLETNDINNIEVPEGTESIAVETVNNGMTAGVSSASPNNGIDIVAAAPADEQEISGVSTSSADISTNNSEQQPMGVGFGNHEETDNE